jgi:hypothetical protein
MATAKLLDGLDLSKKQATKVVELAIKFEAYPGKKPPTDTKALNEAAHEVLSFCVDAWVNEKVRPNDDDSDLAEAANQILQIFEQAGIEVDEDDEIIFPGAEEDEDDEDEGDEDEEGDDEEEDDEDEDDEDEEDGDDEDDDEEDEAAFEPDDYIEGYTELTAASKIKVLKALDDEDEDDVNTIAAIRAWEEEQDKPTSRVLNWIDENFDLEDEAEDDDEEEEEDEEETEDDGDESEEPWEGYDKATAKIVTDTLKSAMAEGELTVEQVEYVGEYEKSLEGVKPGAPRKRIVDLCAQLKDELESGGDDDDEEPAPAPKKRGRKTRGASDPDESAEVDDAVAADDESEARVKKVKKGVTGSGFKNMKASADSDDLPEGMAESFANSRLHSAALEVAGLGEPSDWEGDMPELPNDASTLDHDQLSDLHAQFTNAHSTALWHASKNYVEADAWEEIAEYLRNQAILNSDQSNESKRRAEAETDSAYLDARSNAKSLHRNYVRFRDLAHTLDKKAKAASRIGGFLGDEAENEEARVAKTSTRGKAAGAKVSAKGTGRARARR